MKNKNFNEVFGTSAEYFYKAPARINLIGEHIDYNGGLVLPAAISLFIKGMVSIREDLKLYLYSTSFDSLTIVDFDNLEYQRDRRWANYPTGVFYTLIKKGYKIDKGLNIYFDSNIPLGSGISSSAALLDLTMYIANDIYKLELSRKEIAKLAQEVENKYCGLSCGIMDQAIISLGKVNNALLLDCASFNYEYVPLDLNEYSFVVLKTNKKRKLTESKYNERVEECNKGLELLKKHYSINNLCELDINELDNIKRIINDDIIYKRVKHVITEQNRVKEFVSAMKNNDINKLGLLLNESDYSLKNDYEVTGLHLDTITNEARKYGALGARMTGAGFGGCAIALIKTADFNNFSNQVKKEYYNITNIKPDILLVDIVNGVNKE